MRSTACSGAASLPFVAAAERQALKNVRCAPFALLGIAAVVGLTLLRGGSAVLENVSFASLAPLPPLGLATFDAPAFLLGAAVLLGLELLRKKTGMRAAGGKGPVHEP